ncbi:uncharacterized protein LOC117267457 [Epinephelus lanceolatus]
MSGPCVLQQKRRRTTHVVIRRCRGSSSMSSAAKQLVSCYWCWCAMLGAAGPHSSSTSSCRLPSGEQRKGRGISALLRAEIPLPFLCSPEGGEQRKGRGRAEERERDLCQQVKDLCQQVEILQGLASFEVDDEDIGATNTEPGASRKRGVWMTNKIK